MPPSQRSSCIVCKHQPSRYTCASCRVNYCSVSCYSQHKETCSTLTTDSVPPEVGTKSQSESAPKPIDVPPDPHVIQELPRLRPLTTLKWPYVPDVSAYPDPLTRDDPKPLQLHQYESLATSLDIRTLLQSNPRLCELLTSINALRGAEREEALQRALGVNSRLKNDDASTPLDEDTKVFREFAEIVEVAVRGGREDVLGLDWD